MADAPNPIQLQKHLKGVDYPAGKSDLINTARDQGADDTVLNALERIPDREYDGPNAVSKAVSEAG
ncbi:DUF2795 domain-containing protein [Microbispora triticiradicis]|uniref:DUF2795 domain-containing protein n=3 Tax=Microbispora TaxID=2005 RepID=A0ABY3LWH3_9ACTN|nr:MULTISPECIES: DUF2795 domain-containing protein [Microbispora]RGA04691.1 DUF2795 domain-containing protein [Microbispora triticiradicis]TLP58624.1 DUF2795 domain-containing protein [Microbispora fusca]TYB57750.1 DUF2795 domain-containing protein [Microbispora tritici]GLW21296.1 hypothetical protein Mame01_13390 [Microbispora amethystogenes]